MKTYNLGFLHILRIADIPTFLRIFLFGSGSCNTHSALVKLSCNQGETSSAFLGMEPLFLYSLLREEIVLES